MNLFLVFFISFSRSEELEISCLSLPPVYLNSGQSYNVSISGDLLTHFAIIGDFNRTPDLNYLSQSQVWQPSLSLYDLHSYAYQLPYLLTPSLNNSGYYTFSICLFGSKTQYDYRLDAVPYQRNLNENLNSLCLGNECKCGYNYFGFNCSVKLNIINDDYFEFFTIQGYSLIYFNINTSMQVYYRDYNKSLQIFFNNDNVFIPSFFNFTNYRNGHNDISSNYSILKFTAFCSGSRNCSFLIGAENENKISTGMIVGVTLSFGISILICGVCCLVYFKRIILTRNANIGFKREDIGKFALIENYKHEDNNDTCSICLQEFTENDQVRVINKCRHCFHVTCIDQWLVQKRLCPNCNTKLD